MGIGASAGGLESLQRFFRAVPSDSGLCYVVVQHLSASFKSMMDSLLRRCTMLPIDVAQDGMVVEPNHVYLNPPARLIRLVDDHIELADYDEGETLHLPIDSFFESVASARGPRAAAVVLSGTGSDGARGLRAVHDRGGMVIAESRATAGFTGMPRSAVETGVVDAVLAPEEMPPILRARLGGGPSVMSQSTDPIDDILRALRARYDIDFGLYRRGTLGRRLERRSKLGDATDIRAYAQAMVNDPEELQAALSDLLIGVTTFFRDPECFDALAGHIRERLPDLSELRIWSTGCATGEEAYSLAMMATELVDELERKIPIKVFATDVHAQALQQATAGLYSADDVENVSPARLERFFINTNEGYRVAPELRRIVVFAQHDLLHDAPFTGIHVVVCRNMLIYLGDVGQQRALSYMRFAMDQGGLLLLGPSEATQLGPTFEALDETRRIFVARSKPPTPTAPASLRVARPPTKISKSETALLSAYDRLCDRYMPPGFMLDSQRGLVDSFAGAERFLSVSGRRPSTEFLDMLQTDDRGSLVSALRRAETGERVKIPRMSLGTGEDQIIADLHIEQVDGSTTRPHLLVMIGEPQPYRPETVEVQQARQGSSNLVADLERDLREARIQLQQTIEELEAANEELQASNEEMIASNEELQATNEELSSVNEELYSVNAEYQATNAKLHETNGALEQLFTATQVATVFVDQAMTIRRIVPSPENPIVAATDHDVGRKLESFHHNLDWPGFYAAIKLLLRDGDDLRRRVSSLDGERFWFVQAHRYDIGASAYGAVVTCTDVTELVATEERARAYQVRLDETANTLPILLSYVNCDEVYEFVNDAHVRLWGKPREEIVGRTVEEIFGQAYAEAQPAVRRALAGEKVDYTLELPDNAGKNSYNLVSYTPAIVDGEVKGFYAAVTDITERRETELALEVARAAADSAALAKSEFLANMSHEIRTPMTAILGYADLIAAGTTEQTTARHAETIRRNGRHLIGVIDDVLDLSRIEHRGTELERVAVSPAQLAADVHELFRVRALRKGLELQLQLADPLPTQITTHPQSIRQILFNLISNAIKFTATGTIVLAMGFDVDDGGMATLVTTVVDSGIGFPKDLASKLFEPFEQLDGSHTRNYHGTGLGLAISLRLATALGGQLSASGAPDRGATFMLRLPIGPAATLELHQPVITPRAIESADLVDLDGLVLVVDDAEDVRLLIRDILQRAGAEVTMASSGADALALIDDGTMVDAVVLDIQMPGMDGLEVTRRLRASGFQKPILAVTARAMPGDETECLAAGCSGYMSKPVDVGELTQRIAALMQLALDPGAAEPQPPQAQARAQAPEQEPEPKSTDGRKQILVVEDNPDAAEMLVVMLELHGIDASSAGTVADAIEAYQQRSPDAILCDLTLPDGEGSQLAQFVRAQGDDVTRLIAVSGRHGGEVTAQEAGFDAFLLKPVSIQDLLDKIHA